MLIPNFFTALEAQVLEAILEGEDNERPILREQLSSAIFISRENNGYGFFTNFETAPEAPNTHIANFELHCSAWISGEHCGFLLFVRSGRIDMLEGFPYEKDEWPKVETVEKIVRS